MRPGAKYLVSLGHATTGCPVNAAPGEWRLRHAQCLTSSPALGSTAPGRQDLAAASVAAAIDSRSHEGVECIGPGGGAARNRPRQYPPVRPRSHEEYPDRSRTTELRSVGC